MSYLNKYLLPASE